MDAVTQAELGEQAADVGLDRYRRGLIRTTLAVSPGRGRVLAAKAIACLLRRRDA